MCGNTCNHFGKRFDAAFKESKESGKPIVNEFGQSRGWDEILASGYITLWEYLAQLTNGCARDDLSWDCLRGRGDDIIESFGVEGEFAYGVNLTPSRYVVGLIRLLGYCIGDTNVVINLETNSAEYMGEALWNTLTGDIHERFANTGGQD